MIMNLRLDGVEMDYEKQIEALIEAGKRIPQRDVYASPIQKDDFDLEFTTIGFEDVSEKPFPNHCEGTLMEVWEHDFPGYSEFVTQAANARPAIEAMYAENKRLREAMKEIKAMLDCQFCADGTTNGIKGDYMKTLIAISEKALKGGE
jgi:hypothetical protein